jgi:hypothetical protein
MAITKTTTVHRIEVIPGADDPALVVSYTDFIDDPDDDQLPLRATRTIHLERITHSVDEDGNATSTPTDLSKHDPLVQTIAAAVWAD